MPTALSWLPFALAVVALVLPCRAGASCPYAVEDGANASSLDLSQPLLFRATGGDAMKRFDLAWLRREFGIKAVAVGHPGNYVLGSGSVQDKMLLGRYLDVLSNSDSADSPNPPTATTSPSSDPTPTHIHSRSFVFDNELDKQACAQVIAASGYAEALHGVFNANAKGNDAARDQDHKCSLSIGKRGGGLGLHQHYASVLVLLRGRKRWWFKRTAPKDPSLLDPIRGHHTLTLLPVTGDDKMPGLHSCVQFPGDVVYVPREWYHGTSNDENNGITFGIAWQETLGHKQSAKKRRKKVKRLLKLKKGKASGTVWSLLFDARLLLDELQEKSKLHREILETRVGKRLFERAEHFVKKAKEIRAHEMDFRPNVLLAEMYAKSGRIQDGAREMLEAAWVLSSVNRTAVPANLLSGWLYHIGHILRNVDVLDRAITLLEELFSMSPKDTLMRTMAGLELGVMHWSMENDEEAEAALRALGPELRRVFGTSTQTVVAAVPGVTTNVEVADGANIVDFLDSSFVNTGKELAGHLVPEFLRLKDLEDL